METLKKPSLFWDIDSKGIDPVAHADFIIQRILDKGDVDDFNWAVDFYGKDLVEKVFQKNIDKLNSKSNNFWCFYFNIDKSQCIRKQLIKKQSPFWQR